MSFTCIIARTPEEISDAQRVRCRVYCDEEGLLPASACPDGRDRDPRDDGDATVHFVVYASGQPVGTVRLTPPRLAVSPGCSFGLELESKFDLTALALSAITPAEVTRFCVLRRYRGTRVTEALFRGLREESARRGITHWVAGANMATDFVEDAALAHQVVVARGLVSHDVRAVPRGAPHPPAARRRAFYTDAERQEGVAGNVAGLRLPGPISLFASRMGARYIGAPVFDVHFGVFALPLVTRLDQLVGGASATASSRRPPPIPAAALPQSMDVRA